MSNKEVTWMGKMEKLSEDVRRRKWNFIGRIMTKGYDNGREDVG